MNRTEVLTLPGMRMGRQIFFSNDKTSM